MSFPPPPTTALDWNNLGFKVREVNGHIECRYSRTEGDSGWSKPQFVASPYLSIHGMAPGLNYAVQCYEGMKAFRQPDGKITVFRPDQNAERFAHSASIVSMPAVPKELFLEAVNLAVAVNAEFVPSAESGAAMYVRPLLFGSSAQLGLNPADEYMFVVFVMPTGVYHGVNAVDALILEDFDRAAPFGTGHAKVGGNYGPVLKHSEKAYKAGYGITLHLDSQTRSEIDEFSTSGFIGVRIDGDKKSIVAPDSKCAIKSVTSTSACEIARDLLGFEFEKRPVKYEELPEFKEVFAAGTAASLVPIRSITMESKKDKIEYEINEKREPGPVCTEILRILKGIQQGKVKDEFGWNMTVTEPPKGFVPETNGKATNGETVDRLP